jgi:hypothetical protein
MADNVEVKLGADVGSLKSDMSDASASVADSLAKIADALQKFGSDNKRVTEEALKNNADLSRSFLELKGSLTGGFNAIAGVVERFRGVIGGLAGLLAGGLLGREAVKSMLDLEDSVRGLEISFGMTSQKATQMSIALKLAGASAESYEQMGFRVGRVLKTQSDEFDRLGVITKDASGNLLPLDEILQNIYKRMQDFKAGTDQTEFALSTVGRNAKDFASDMQRLQEVQERSIELQKQLGIEMGPDRQSQIEGYRIELNAFRVVLDEIGTKVGEQMLPNLIKLAEWFNSEGKTAVEGAVGAFNALASAVTILFTLFKDLGVLVASVTVSMQIRWQATAEAFSAAARGHFIDAYNILAAANQRLVAENKNALDTMLGNTKDALAKLQALWSGAAAIPPAGPAPIPGSGTARFTPKPAAGGETSQLPAFREELERMKEAQGYFNELSKADEAAFWAAKLDMVKTYSRDWYEIQHLAYQARKADAHEEFADSMALFAQLIAAATDNKDRQLALAHDRTQYVLDTFKTEGKEYQVALEQETKLRAEWQKKDEKMVEDAAKHNISMLGLENEYASSQYAQAVALRQINVQQQYQLEAQLENRIYEAKRAELEREKALLTEGTIDYQRATEAIEDLEFKHQLKLTDISNKAELDRKQYAIQAADAVTSAFANFFSSISSGTAKASDAFKKLASDITASLSKIAAEMLAKQLFGAGTTGGGFLNSIFGTIFGGAGGGISSVFGAFATGTPYVPQDMLAVVHKGEAIIPAALNRGGGASQLRVTNQFVLGGVIDTRTQAQIALASSRSLDLVSRRYR